MTKPSKAYQVMPDVPCPTCGHIMPKISRQPITASLQVHWDNMIFIERKLLAACLREHRLQPYQTWRCLPMAQKAFMDYRQVMNAIRRLVPTGWLQRVSRGLYRITPHAVAQLAWVHPRWTINKVAETTTAQVQGTEDKV